MLQQQRTITNIVDGLPNMIDVAINLPMVLLAVWDVEIKSALILIVLAQDNGTNMDSVEK